MDRWMKSQLIIIVEVMSLPHAKKRKPLFTLISVSDGNGGWWDQGIHSQIKLDPAEIETIRSNFPLYNQRRFDVYADVADSVVVDENGNGTKKQ